MIRSFIKNRKYLLAFLACVTLIVFILLGCKKEEYDNPYDSKVPATSWAPYDLTAFQTSLKTVVLRWTQLDQRIDSFCIEAKRGQGEWTVIGYSDKNTHTFIDTALIPDPTETQVYRVHALAWKNNSIYAINSIKPTFTKPNAPFVTKAFGVKIKLTWFDNYKNEDNYKIEKKVEGGNWVLCSDTIGGNSELYYDTTPELNTQIMYRLSVKAAGFYSDTTQSHKISTLIAPPTWFFIASLSQTSCRIEWKQGDSWTTGYNVDRQFGNEPWQDGWLKLDSASTSFTDINLPIDQDIKYRVSTMVNNTLSVKTDLIYGLAVLDSISITNSTYTSVNITTRVKSETGSAVTEWGIVYSASPNPTILDTKVVATTAGNIGFTTTITGLDNSKTYYTRPYAINRRGVSYGKQKIFTSSLYIVPQLDLTVSQSVSYTDASFNSKITKDGGVKIIESGFVCSANTNPTITDMKAMNTNNTAPANGVYQISGAFHNLTIGSIYYVRSYAINSVGVGYGSVKAITMLPLTVPGIVYFELYDIDAKRFRFSISLLNTGGDINTKRGVVYSANLNPTIADNIWTDPSGNPEYTSDGQGYITGLTINTTYHVRGYAQNIVGTVYSADRTFTTTGLLAPTLLYGLNVFPGSTNVIMNFQVRKDGGEDIIESGIVYSTSFNPTINDNKVVGNAIAPDYLISCNLTGLVSGVTYHCRSFARNSIGITYSGDYSFKTLN